VGFVARPGLGCDRFHLLALRLPKSRVFDHGQSQFILAGGDEVELLLDVGMVGRAGNAMM